MTNIIDLTKRVRDFRDTYRGIDELGACDLLDEVAHALHTLGADLYKAEGQRNTLEQKLAAANGCISSWVTFGSEVTETLGQRVMLPNEILAEIARLRGLRPELPERPMHNNDASYQHPALPRYGLRWNGPGEPVSVPMPDGYWTPFHLALEAATSQPAGAALTELIAKHGALLETNSYAYFELAYTRSTGWMAWITDKPAKGEPGTAEYASSRKVIARGQGDTPEEAAADALAALAKTTP